MVSNPQFLAGEKLSAIKLQLLGFQDTYVPVLTATTTNPDLGSSPTQSGYLVRSGNIVTLWVYIQFGTSPSAGSGTYRVSIPTAYPYSTSYIPGAIGTAWLNDNSTGNQRVAVVRADQTSDTMVVQTTSDNAIVTAAAPWTWAASDVLSLQASYPID